MIFRVSALAVAAALCVAAPARAAAELKSGEEHVDYAGVPIPIVVNGRLVNYVFVVLRLVPQPGADPTRIKEREPFVRDYLVRLAHKQPFVVPQDLTRVDSRRLLSAVAAQAPRLIGPRLVRSVGIASATPQRRSGLPSFVPPAIVP